MYNNENPATIKEYSMLRCQKKVVYMLIQKDQETGAKINTHTHTHANQDLSWNNQKSFRFYSEQHPGGIVKNATVRICQTSVEKHLINCEGVQQWRQGSLNLRAGRLYMKNY